MTTRPSEIPVIRVAMRLLLWPWDRLLARWLVGFDLDEMIEDFRQANPWATP